MNPFASKVTGYNSVTSIKINPITSILHRLFQKFEVAVSIDSRFEVSN